MQCQKSWNFTRNCRPFCKVASHRIFVLTSNTKWKQEMSPYLCPIMECFSSCGGAWKSVSLSCDKSLKRRREVRRRLLHTGRRREHLLTIEWISDQRGPHTMYKSIINGVFPATKPLEALLARDGATEPTYLLHTYFLKSYRFYFYFTIDLSLLKCYFKMKLEWWYTDNIYLSLYFWCTVNSQIHPTVLLEV